MIPRELRDKTGLTPGVSVQFVLDGDRVVLSARKPDSLRGRFAEGPDMAARLLEDRGREPR